MRPFQTLILLSISFISFSARGEISSPENIKIKYAEKSLGISWDTVPGAIGYNIYTSNSPPATKTNRIKINKKLITSGTHFTYIWHFENGEKVRKIKGYKHHIAVTSVFEINGKKRESKLSKEKNNSYFDGFDRINTKTEILTILQDSQRTPLLPVVKYSNEKKNFIEFMTGPGKGLYTLIKKQIDFKEVGACAPISTVLVKLLQHYGLNAFRIDGTFIREFHTFIIINVDKVEYVLDFTADQFVPGVIPVLIPRDYCHLNEQGKLALEGIPVYRLAKVYNADQVELSNDTSAVVYKDIYNTIVKKYK